MPQKRVIPKFVTEAEEADWWHENRTAISRDLKDAVKKGEARILTKEIIKERLASRPVTIRLSEADIQMAQKQAEAKGLPYQTYIKSLLHETLISREH